MTIKTVQWPVHSEEEIQAVRNILSSGCTNYWTGQEAHAFEKEFAETLGTRYAISLMNGSVALEAALYALDIGPGDEVITTSRSFVASASCIVQRGATPVFVDVDLDSQNITAKTIEPYITCKTKAIIVVHLAGWAADMKSILVLANHYHLKVIEDCAQAHGARYLNCMVGAWGDVAAFSFCQDKIISTGGEGGLVTTNDLDIWKKIWSYKDHGKNYDKLNEPSSTQGYKWVHDSIGTNWRMTEIQAAIGRIQLKKLPAWLDIRRKHAAILSAAFAYIPGLRITLPPSEVEHAYYKYYVFIEHQCLKTSWSRDRILQELNNLGVTCFMGSCGEIYLEKALERWRPLTSRINAKQLAETSLMFLVHPTVHSDELTRAAEILKKIMEMATVQVSISHGQ